MFVGNLDVDFSREFHDEAAAASNITRVARLFERAGMDADAFKRWWTRYIPQSMERSTYVLCISIASRRRDTHPLRFEQARRKKGDHDD